MTLSIRRLGPGDAALLELLAREDGDFDLAERGAPLSPLSAPAAQAYLGDPNVLHWIAERDGAVVGHLLCHLLRKRSGRGSELILYEIGVRAAHRRSGVGRRLIETMHAWMTAHDIAESWVLADNPDAVKFYRACAYEVEQPPPVYLTFGSEEGT